MHPHRELKFIWLHKWLWGSQIERLKYGTKTKEEYIYIVIVNALYGLVQKYCKEKETKTHSRGRFQQSLWHALTYVFVILLLQAWASNHSEISKLKWYGAQTKHANNAGDDYLINTMRQFIAFISAIWCFWYISTMPQTMFFIKMVV